MTTMTRIVSASEFQRNFERFQEEAKTTPIAISRDGHAESVLMSAQMYDLIVRGRIARSVTDFDEATLEAIRASEVPPEFDHLDALLGDWKP
jgi:hypothetical protein